MRKQIQFALFAAAMVSLPMLAPKTAARKLGAAEPVFDARKHRTQYAGPAGETAGVADVEEVRIGYFGPSDPKDPLGGDMWLAAQWAIEQANASGGYRGKPFKLMVAWSRSPWANGVKKLVGLVYRQRIWAIVGGIDGASTHLAEQVVAKARLTLISPVSSDPTTNLVNVPWMFSVSPGDHLTAGPLVLQSARRVGTNGLVILSADDHDSRIFTLELRKALKKRRIGLRRQFEFRKGAKQSDPLVAQVLKVRPAAVIIAAGPGDSARLVSALRAGEYEGEIIGGPAMGRREFLAQASGAGCGVVFPLLYNPSNSSKAAAEFSKAFHRKHGHLPDYTAAYTYDAMRMLIAAIRKAGLNRARIRDAVAGLAPWTGVTGAVRWNGLGSNTRATWLGTIKAGRLRALPRPPGKSASTRRWPWTPRALPTGTPQSPSASSSACPDPIPNKTSVDRGGPARRCKCK